MGPMIHPPPPPDPFAPLMALMRPVAPLDILQKMSFLWTTNDTFRYELLAWDEGGGTLILGTKRGDLEIIECAFPPPPPLPRAQTGRAHP
ncbi:hypothetical protein FRC12_011001 [Ceratobasidium sp. 428]|nr:hypothetical protein FRC12_011001 [Ceratobasidium sp. 428]